MAQSIHAAPEYVQSEQTAPGSIHETVESAEYAFKTPQPLQIFSTLNDVFREGNFTFSLRNYYFHRDRNDKQNIAAWAQGGNINYATPWWRDRLHFEATLYTSQKLYGPTDKDGTKLLKPGQKSFTVLGQAHLEARLFGDLFLKVYRQAFELPYLNGNDSRMVPNTFEATTLYNFSGDRFVYGIAQTWRIKKRDATNFVSMTEAAGIDGPDRAVSSAAARYTFLNDANVSAVNHYGHDFMNIFYAEGNSRTRTVHGLGFQFSGQFTRQNTIGDELGGNFDTRSWGAKVATSYAGLVLNLAHTSTANNAGIQNNWGGSPSYLSIMIKNFDRAGEDAWLFGVSTDFRFLGENPFSGFINYAYGDTPDDGRNASPDQAEFDMTVDYKPKAGMFRGLWFRLRGALVNQDDGTDLRDIRFIVNYDFSAF